jgi:opacity protein-like surface antigen
VIAFNPAFVGEHRVDNILTAGVRLGWALQRAMPYITAGYAGAAVSDRATFAAGAAVGQTFWRSRERHDGYYIGGGVDWAVHCCDSSWTIGIEYRHYEFDETRRVPASVGGVLVTGDRHILDLDGVDTLTVRLNYKLGRPASTLK